KLDVLEDLEYIKICTAYEHEGKVFKNFPMDFYVVRLAKPVYEEMPGWQSSIQGINKYDDLPDNAKKYLLRLEELLKVEVKYISTGTKRDEIIFR
ncbi:Adenylosuccinate synthetase, partial [Candidatus Magnetomorum sp. HK-1]